MKRILQRVFIVVAVLAVVIGIGSYFLTHDPDRNKGEQPAGVPTVVDASGTTYGVVVNEQGTTYVVVTDGETNRYMAEYDGVTAGSTVAQINSDVQASDLPTNYTGPDVSVSQNINDYMGEVVTSTTQPVASTTLPVADPSQQGGAVTQAPGTTGTEQKNPTVPSSGAAQSTQPTGTTPTQPSPSTPSGNTQQYKIKKYEEIFKTGTYLMTVKMDDPELPEPTTVAFKNGNMYVEMAMVMEEGKAPLRLRMIYLKSSDTMYLLIDDLKKYCKLPEEMAKELDMGSVVSGSQITTVGDITVSQADINGKTLTVESYINQSGETVNYYFDGDNIVRVDTVKKSGAVESIFYSQFTTDVPDSYFEIPDDYGYWNLSFLGAFL